MEVISGEEYVIAENTYTEDNNIKVNITNRDMAEDKELNPHESYNLHFTVVWDYNSIKEIKEAKSFNLIINCKQAI